MNLIKNAYKAIRLKSEFGKIDDAQKQEHALAYISELFESEKGLFLKLGQFLGAKEKYSKLSKSVYSYTSQIDRENIEKVFEKQFNESLKTSFTYENKSSALASLSQVVFLKDKETAKLWVLKSFLPGIEKEIESQMNTLGLVPNVGPQKKWGVDISLYKKLIGDLVEKELSFDNEIKCVKEFSSRFGGNKSIKLVEIHPNFQSDKLYLQSYAPGEDLQHYLNKPDSLNPKLRKKLGLALMEFYLISFFFCNKLQSDGNWGNFRLNLLADGEIELWPIDFGAVYEYQKSFVQACFNLLIACKENRDYDLVKLLCDLGFEESKLLHIEEHLASLLKIILEPFVSERPYDLKNWNLDMRMDALLGEQKWWFRSAGGKDFFVLLKSISSVLGILERLDVKLDFYNLIEKNSLAQRIAMAGASFEKRESNKSMGFDLLAKEIEILVYENKEEKVRLKLPIRSIYNLEEYMDDDLKEKLVTKSVDYSKVIKDFIASKGSPCLLFEHKEKGKTFKISAL